MNPYNERTIAPIGFLPFLIEPKFRIYRHLVALLAITTVICSNKVGDNEPGHIYVRSVLAILSVFIFYTNMYWLVPKFLFRNKYPQYGLGIAAYISLVFLSGEVVEKLASIERPREPGMYFFIYLIMIQVAASTAIKLFQRWISDTRRITELETTTMQSELEQLKNQINPHFLLNMLNNANVLTQRDPGTASQVLMKLSDFLRYQLYDSARTNVLLTAEIHFVTDLLNLEKIRRDDFRFTVSQEGCINGVQVAPLLFVIFVENAVKHSLDAEGGSYVNLHFGVQNDLLHFKCVNSRPDLTIETKGVGGLGLTNVRRRLKLLYPGTHSLTIDNDRKSYAVTLTIDL